MVTKKCGICSEASLTCGHLLAHIVRDDQAEIDAGATIDDGDLISLLSKIVDEAIRTGEYVWLNDAFSSILDEARNSHDPDDDYDGVGDMYLPQLNFALCEIIAGTPGVIVDEDEDESFYWTSDPADVIAVVKSDLNLELEQLENSPDALDDDEDEDDENDDDESEENDGKS